MCITTKSKFWVQHQLCHDVRKCCITICAHKNLVLYQAVLMPSVHNIHFVCIWMRIAYWSSDGFCELQSRIYALVVEMQNIVDDISQNEVTSITCWCIISLKLIPGQLFINWIILKTCLMRFLICSVINRLRIIHGVIGRLINDL